MVMSSERAQRAQFLYNILMRLAIDLCFCNENLHYVNDLLQEI